MKRFLVIDDHEVLRMGLRGMLSLLYGSCKVNEAADGDAAIACLKEHTYDLVITDVQLPNTEIFSLIEYIMINYPSSRILVFSMSSENIYAKKFLRAGAMGFVSKSAPIPELKKAIIMILEGHKYVSPLFARQLTDELGVQNANPFYQLTPKEFEVCIHLIASRSVTAISKLLSISTSTVGTHKAHILAKLKVINILELSELGKQYSLLR